METFVGLVAVAILLLFSTPVDSADCKLEKITTKAGTGGYTHQIVYHPPYNTEVQKPNGIPISFQWKLNPGGGTYQFELKNTANFSTDWLAIGFCQANDFAQSKSCMDNCDFAIMWKPKDGSRPVISDCHLKRGANWRAFSCKEEGQDFIATNTEASADVFQGTFTRKVDTGNDEQDKRLENQKYFLITGSGEMFNKPDGLTLDDYPFSSNFKHYEQCGRSKAMIFPDGLTETETKGRGHALAGTPILLISALAHLYFLRGTQ